MIASYGPKTFTVSNKKIDTFQDFQSSSAFDTENQELLGKKPSTVGKGSGLDSMSFVIVLMATLGVNPRKELEQWQELLSAGVAYPFILGKKPFGKNKWLLKGADASDYMIDSEGLILSLKLSLKFEEYVRAGKSESAKAQTNATTTTTKAEKKKQATDAIISLTKPADKQAAAARRLKV